MPWPPPKDYKYFLSEDNTMSSSNTFTMNFKLKPMPKHTNLPNEITGEYYKEKTTWYEYGAIFASLLTIVVFILAVLDQVYGAETVTNFIADLLGSLMG